ncbi:MAG TPA: oligosaccharide flippase family protein [Bacteroidales bacterium]|nr:oligosaccharide flippase family protein [Bacteroidales bacterium]
MLNLLIKPFWLLGIDRSVQNTVGASEYGFYFALLNFSFLFHILLDFGITNYNNRNISQNQQLVGKHFPNIFVIKLLLFFVYLLFTIGGAFVIDYSREQILLLLVLACNQLLMSMILYLRSNLSGLQLFRTDGLISILDRSLMIILVGVLLWGNLVDDFKIRHFVFAQTVSYLLTFLITFYIVYLNAGIRLLKFSFNLPFMLVIIRQSYPFALLVLIMTLFSRIDSVMLERMLEDGARFSGIYASAFRLFDAAVQFSFLFAVLLLPIFSRMLKFNQKVDEITGLSFILVITPAIILSIGSFFYSSEIMALLYPVYHGETDAQFAFRMAESGRAFALLMLCLIGASASYILGTVLTANGNLKILNVIALGGLCVNFVLNLLLIPGLKAEGAALASLATLTFVAIVQAFVVIRIFRFKISPGYLVRFLLLIAGTVLVSIMSRFLPFPWFINIVLMAFGSFFLAILIRFFPIKKFLEIFFSKNIEAES